MMMGIKRDKKGIKWDKKKDKKGINFTVMLQIATRAINSFFFKKKVLISSLSFLTKIGLGTHRTMRYAIVPSFRRTRKTSPLW